MAHQPDLFPPNSQQADPTPSDVRAASSGISERSQAPHSSWTRRVELIVRIIVRLYLGLLLIALPWITFWTQNNLFTYDPLLLTLAGNGFVRGLISGLGLLNIVMAALDAIHARRLS